jgi:hypothetical protein
MDIPEEMIVGPLGGEKARRQHNARPLRRWLEPTPLTERHVESRKDDANRETYQERAHYQSTI